jgi:hypothetical protein
MRSASDATPSFAVRSGTQSATVGGSIAPGDGSAVLEVRAPGVRDGRVVFIVNGVRLPSMPVGAHVPARLERILEPGFVRAEIYGADGSLIALTNPVFVE